MVHFINVTQADITIRALDGRLVTIPRSKEHKMDVLLRSIEMDPIEFTAEGVEGVFSCTQAATQIGPISSPVPPVTPGVIYIASIVTYNAAKAAGRTDVCTVNMTTMVRDATGAPVSVSGIAWP